MVGLAVAMHKTTHALHPHLAFGLIALVQISSDYCIFCVAVCRHASTVLVSGDAWMLRVGTVSWIGCRPRGC